MSSMLKRAISASFMKPDGLLGWIVLKYMIRVNRHLEENAVKLCNLQPNHRFLEVGFGPGLGLAAAYNIVKSGTGKVYGVDISPYVVQQAENRFVNEVASGRLELLTANVVSLPFMNSKFDRIVHCNCYYYWPNVEVAAKEIHRIMKNDGLMVTALDVDHLRRNKQRGWKARAKIDPLFYMTALENVGFVDVHMEYLKQANLRYQVIYAKKRI